MLDDARTLRLSVEASASSLPQPRRQRRLGPYTALVGQLERLSERHASNRTRHHRVQDAAGRLDTREPWKTRNVGARARKGRAADRSGG